MVSGRNKSAAECVHLRERANLTCIAEVICKLASCKAWTRRRLNSDNSVISLASELFAYKRRDKTAEVRAAAGTTDNNVRLYIIFIKSFFSLKTDNRLVEKYLIKHTAEYIAVTLGRCSNFNSLGNCTAKTACCARVLLKNFSADCSICRRGRSNTCTVSSHNFSSERLLFVRYFYHIYLTIKTKVRTSH